jgi:thermostable 8-oxoguanine DNA glycosylase
MKARRQDWEAEDFAWEALLGAFSTIGNARGAELVRDPQLHQRVRYEALKKRTTAARKQMIEAALRKAKVRMPSRKTEWLLANFDRIRAAGGPLAVKKQLEACVGRGAKINILRTFRGIGDKYARNIMMDVYDPDFRDAIAIDERIKKVATRLGVPTSPYERAERLFLSVAEEAGLNGWELDRLLYNYTDEVLAAFSGATQRGAPAARKGTRAGCKPDAVQDAGRHHSEPVMPMLYIDINWPGQSS